jgi:phosphohistidine phosphatase SixA
VGTEFPLKLEPKRIVIVRHAEKPKSAKPHLAVRGEMRAIGLSKLLPKIVQPDFIFASTSTKNSERPYETIRPMADKMGVDVITTYADKEIKKFVKELRKKKYKGKTVLICWHHGKMPKLIKELGHAPPYDKWPENIYDRIVNIDENGITNIPQQILFGDADK